MPFGGSKNRPPTNPPILGAGWAWEEYPASLRNKMAGVKAGLGVGVGVLLIGGFETGHRWLPRCLMGVSCSRNKYAAAARDEKARAVACTDWRLSQQGGLS